MIEDIAEWVIDIAPKVGLALFALACVLALLVVCAALWRAFWWVL